MPFPYNTTFTQPADLAFVSRPAIAKAVLKIAEQTLNSDPDYLVQITRVVEIAPGAIYEVYVAKHIFSGLFTYKYDVKVTGQTVLDDSPVVTVAIDVTYDTDYLTDYLH